MAQLYLQSSNLSSLHDEILGSRGAECEITDMLFSLVDECRGMGGICW